MAAFKGSIGGMRRDYVKGQYKKLAGGGDLVDDAEKQKFTQQATSQAGQNLGAQQQQLNRAAMAAGAGAPVLAGALQSGAAALGQQAADAAVKASGAEKQYSAALREQRAARTMAAGERLIAQNREDAKMAMEMGFRVAETTGILSGSFGV